MTTNELKLMKNMAGTDLHFRVEERGNIFRAEFWRGVGDSVENFTGMSTNLDRAVDIAFLNALHSRIKEILQNA